MNSNIVHKPLAMGLPLPNAFLSPVASVCLLLWDWALTFGEEIDVMWRAKVPVLSKLLFILVRYPALIMQCTTVVLLFLSDGPSRAICSAYDWFLSITPIFVIICGNTIIIRRLYGLYERSRWVLWSLSGLLGALMLGVLIILTLPNGLRNYLRTMHMSHCGSGPFPRKYLTFWIGELVFQSIAFSLVLGKYIYAQIQASKDNIGASALYLIFMLDGIWVYFILSVVDLLGVIFVPRPGYVAQTCVFWVLTATSICCTRITFNLYASVYRENKCLSLKITESREGDVTTV